VTLFSRAAFLLCRTALAAYGQEAASTPRPPADTQLLPADAVLDRGVALGRMGRFGEARAALAEGRRLFPRDERFALELAGVAYRQNDRAGARRWLAAALRLKPADPYGCDFMATLYLLDGNPEAALKYWNRIGKPLLASAGPALLPGLDPVLWQRAFEASAGQIFTLERLRATESNLDRLGLFADRRFDLVPGTGGRFDLAFRASLLGEPLRGWTGRLVPAARGLPYQTLFLERLNLRGRALHFRSLWRWDPEKRRAAAGISGPLHLDPRRRFRLAADVRDENWDLRHPAPPAAIPFKLQTAEAGGDLAFTLTNRLDWSTGLRVTARRFRHAPAGEPFRGGWAAEQRNFLDFTLWRQPERRLRADSFAGLRTGRLFTGTPRRYAVIEAGLDASWISSHEETYSAQARIRTARTFGALPFDQYFMLGMERDNDFWFRGAAGARGGRKGAAPLGTGFDLLQLDAKRTLFRLPLLRLSAGPFYDAGRAAVPLPGAPPSGWMHAGGLEAELKTGSGIRWTLVWGRDLRGGRGVFYTGVKRQTGGRPLGF
jgi:hypothetical protein